MTATLPKQNDWYLTNHQHFLAVLAQVKQRLQAKISANQRTTELSDDADENDLTVSEPLLEPNTDPTIETPITFLTPEGNTTLDLLRRQLGLSEFELGVLMLCAGMELDSQWASLCAQLQGDPARLYPTLSLALSILPGAVWSSTAPSAPLRRWQLIELGGGHALTTSPIRIDERILHYLTGLQQLDQRLMGLLSPSAPADALVESHQKLVQQAINTWIASVDQRGLPGCHQLSPVVQLVGEDGLSKRAIADLICRQVGLSLYELSAEALPTDLGQLALIKTLCEREYSLSNVAILLDCDHLEQPDNGRKVAISTFLESTNMHLILSTRDRRAQRQRPILSLEVQSPTIPEQRIVWQQGLKAQAVDHIDSLVSQFNMSPTAIRAACLQANSQFEIADPVEQPEHDLLDDQLDPQSSALKTASISHKNTRILWNICRAQARPRLDELAQRIEASTTWDDLILPDKEKAVLAEMTDHVQQRTCVYEDWGFGNKSRRGLGISALFSGASGTGKTTAAEVIARELNLDVYRIDLSSIVSKYIGETEKNLRRVFDAAEGGGVILLFDEADSLFGKRGDVKDSHDRYANMEVSYLLQRMETYRGLAILTTNLKSAMDQAFLRRIRFIVQFPFPDAKQREEIWRKVFPTSTPVEALAYRKLAKLNIAGGNIRNIAVNAAFIAASSGEAVNMHHLLQAARGEYLKLERPLTDSEVKGWV